MSDVEIRLPDVGEGIAQAEVVEWHVAVGDRIVEDQPFVDVMTDKATVELPSPMSGIVRKLAAEVGDFVPVGAPLIWVSPDPLHSADPDEPTTGDGNDVVAASAPAASQPASADAATPTPAEHPVPSIATRSAAGPRPTAAPAVRKRAADLGIDLAELSGTGPDGRVVHADLDARLIGGAAVRSAGTASRSASEGRATTREDVQQVHLTGLRRNIARRMQVANQVPHFSYVEQIDVGALEQLRAQLNENAAEGRPRLTLLPFLMRAVCLAVIDFPGMNARYDAASETLERHRAVHLGIATQAPNGLMVPVVRDAQDGDLWQHAAELRRLASAATDGTIRLAELTGSTITITSLGALGGLTSTPIINAPEVAIIGVNRILQQPAVVDGRLVNRRLMNLSSSFDHRVVDGWDGARFINRIKQLLENPALLFIDYEEGHG